MSKRFTSLLVGTLAAVLMGAPVQAQTLKAKAVAQKKAVHTAVNMQNGGVLRTADLTPQQNAVIREKMEVEELARLHNAAMPGSQALYMYDVFALNGTPLGKAVTSTLNYLPVKAQAPRVNAETVDANGIITSPAEGELKYYKREGLSWFRNNNSQTYGDEEGYTEIVETADGVVYIKDFISTLGFDTYIKGTREGNTITVPNGQKIYQWVSDGYGMVIGYGYWVAGQGFVQTQQGQDITFTVDGDVIKLNGADFDVSSTEGLIIGGFYTDQYEGYFSNFGTSNLVLTYDPTFSVPEPLTLPEGVTAETYLTRGQQYNGNTGAFESFKGEAQLAFDGDDVYLAGIFANFPDAYIKGTKEGNTITFAGTQFVGSYGQYFIYGTGATGTGQGSELADFVLKYDELNQVYVAQNILLANAAEDRVYFLEAFQNLQIAKEFGAPVAITGDPVDELPYLNNFETTDKQGEFGILDANEDNATWSFVEDNGNYVARNNYHSTNYCDDWLISPAIKLEAGKNYRVAFDARAYSASWPERIEVMLGTVAKASALTQTVIPATDLTNNVYETYEKEITVEETGYYHVGIHAISDPYMYYIFVDNFVVEAGAEAGAPAAITDLTVTNIPDAETPTALVTFTAPATAIDGSALTENLDKIDLYRDGEVIKTFENVAPGEQLSFLDGAETGLTQGKHSYQVIPYNSNGAGAKSDVVAETIMLDLVVPFSIDLAQQFNFDSFTVIDNNGDGRTWGWNANYGAYYVYNSSYDADDYLVSPKFTLKAGKNYSVVAKVAAQSVNYPERFEVLVGKAATVDALNITAIPATDVAHTESLDYEGDFTAPEDGEYYVAIHAISDADRYYLKVASISLEKGLEPNSPAAPRLGVQPDPYGAEKAVVTVTAPTRSIDGNKLNGNLSKLVVRRDGEIVKIFENVAPSDIKVFADNAATGTHTYQAIPYDQSGEAGKKSEAKTVFVGLDTPSSPENAKAIEQTNGLIFSWDAVTTGANGGVVVPGEVEYSVYTGHLEQSWFGQQWVLDDVIATTTETSVFIEDDQTGEQELVALFVSAKNEQGESSANGNYYFKGQPYQMPFQEHFGSSEWDHSTWVIEDATANVDMDNSTDASDGDGGAYYFESTARGEMGTFTPGKIAVRPGNTTVIFDAKSSSVGNTLTVQVLTVDGTVSTVAAFKLTDSYKTYKTSIAQFGNEPFVKVLFRFDFNAPGRIDFDNVKITDLLEYNLTASIDAPATVQAGQSAKVTVNVVNQGENAAKDFGVKILAGDNVLYNETVTEPIASFGEKVISVDFNTTIFDEPGDVVVRAEVDYDLDLDLDDNEVETTINVKQSAASAPENVKGEKTANGVKLTWNAPSNSVQQVTEDFLSYENLSNATGQVGDWQLVNNNGATKGGLFNDFDMPNDGKVAAWELINPEVTGITNTEFADKNGSLNYAFMLSNYNQEGNEYPDNDDWLISPALPGVAQTVSFDVRALSVQYGAQSYQVLYSTTDDKISSFVEAKSVTLSNTTWLTESVEIPEGATYFAIRNTTNGDASMAVMVTNVTFTRGGGNVAKYNIWVDGELAESTTATSIELEGATTSNVFAVSAVYANGSESRPVVFVFAESDKLLTGIEAITGSNSPVDIYSLDGKLVRSQATDLKGLKGAYIIEGRKVIFK